MLARVYFAALPTVSRSLAPRICVQPAVPVTANFRRELTTGLLSTVSREPLPK